MDTHRTSGLLQLATRNPELYELGTHFLVRLRDRRVDFQGVIATLQADGHVATSTTAHQDESTFQAPQGNEASIKNDVQLVEHGGLSYRTQRHLNNTARFQWMALLTYVRASSYHQWTLVVLMICGKQLL